eukprot:251831_1
MTCMSLLSLIAIVSIFHSTSAESPCDEQDVIVFADAKFAFDLNNDYRLSVPKYIEMIAEGMAHQSRFTLQFVGPQVPQAAASPLAIDLKSTKYQSISDAVSKHIGDGKGNTVNIDPMKTYQSLKGNSQNSVKFIGIGDATYTPGGTYKGDEFTAIRDPFTFILPWGKISIGKQPQGQEHKDDTFIQLPNYKAAHTTKDTIKAKLPGNRFDGWTDSDTFDQFNIKTFNHKNVKMKGSQESQESTGDSAEESNAKYRLKPEDFAFQAALHLSYCSQDKFKAQFAGKPYDVKGLSISKKSDIEMKGDYRRRLVTLDDDDYTIGPKVEILKIKDIERCKFEFADYPPKSSKNVQISLGTIDVLKNDKNRFVQGHILVVTLDEYITEEYEEKGCKKSSIPIKQESNRDIKWSINKANFDGAGKKKIQGITRNNQNRFRKEGQGCLSLMALNLNRAGSSHYM